MTLDGVRGITPRQKSRGTGWTRGFSVFSLPRKAPFSSVGCGGHKKHDRGDHDDEGRKTEHRIEQEIDGEGKRQNGANQNDQYGEHDHVINEREEERDDDLRERLFEPRGFFDPEAVDFENPVNAANGTAQNRDPDGAGIQVKQDRKDADRQPEKRGKDLSRVFFHSVHPFPFA